MLGKRATLFAAVLILSVTSAAADEDAKYLCIGNKSTGFKYENGNWNSVDFKVDKRYLVAVKKHWFKDEVLYSITEFGKDRASFYCDKEAPDKYGYIICEEGLGSFRVNIRTLRYMDVYPVGYIDGKDNNATDTPSIEIGTCTKL